MWARDVIEPIDAKCLQNVWYTISPKKIIETITRMEKFVHDVEHKLKSICSVIQLFKKNSSIWFYTDYIFCLNLCSHQTLYKWLKTFEGKCIQLNIKFLGIVRVYRPI